VVGVAGHEGDGDGALGIVPLESEGLTLGDLVVGVEEDGLSERSGRKSENSADGELHCELN
jgi:hypothetical protein